MRELLLALMLLATFAQAAIMRQSLLHQRDIVTTRDSLKKLAAITVQVFRGQDPPVGTAFWQGLNRTEPMYDVWGQEFRLEILKGETNKEFIWHSAGPDRQYGTPDDIRARVPYQKGVTLDLTHPEINRDSGPSSTNAN